jgi:hypothetical protein
VSGDEQHLQIDLDALSIPYSGPVQDLITGSEFPVDASGDLGLKIAPYQVLWLMGRPSA